MSYSGYDNLEIMEVAKNYNNFLVKNIVSIIKKYNYKTVVDYGCSNGYFIEKICRLIQNKVKICGVEIDDTALSQCKKKHLTVYDDISKIKEGQDFIYSLNVLEHIENDAQVLTQMYSKLSKSGRILIYVPALMFLFSSMDVKVGHYRRYNKENIQEILEKSKFVIERIEYCDSMGIFATILYIIKDKFSNNANGNINKTVIAIYDLFFPISRLLDILLFKHVAGKNIIVVAKKF